ncbi:hypothetical protein ACFQ2M_30275 [Kitasatospora saccharophila]|uniref:hypothetical protein n=1 Tax=Kitasatospora saccharophila TaxID=407973 RepID=UPI0036372E50
MRERIDAELALERYVPALRLLRGAADGIGLVLGREILYWRLLPAPPDPLADAEALTGRVAGADAPVLAVRAARAGAGVELLLESADGSRVLTAVDAATAARYLRPGEPVADGAPAEAAEAAAEWLGRQAAAALGVPFHGIGEG